MPVSVTMPQLGESVTEGTVTRWLKAVGDTIIADEPLLEVSTDKVDTEIPAPASGVLLSITVSEDEVVAVGAELAVIGDSADAPAIAPAAPAAAPEPAAAVVAPVPAPVQSPAPAPTAAPVSAPVPSTAGTTSIVMPALGESVTEGTVTRWLKAVGDTVVADEAILEVSTDKVDTEIPAPVSGTLLSIAVGEDSTVLVGAELGVIGSAAAGIVSTPEAPPAPENPSNTPVSPVVKRLAEENGVDLATISGTGQDGRVRKEDVLAAVSMPVTVNTDAVTSTPASDPADSYVTPLVRRLASQNDIDLASISGTGIGGRIRKSDVLDAVAARSAPAAVPAAAPQASTTTAQQATTLPRGRTEKMSRLRKVIAERMLESLQVSAQLTTVVEVDVSRIAQLRNKVKGEFEAREGVKLSFLPFFCKAAVEALKQYPQVNASIDMGEGTVTYHESEHLGIAVDSERGLLVPVVRDAGDLNIAGLARRIADLADRTRTNKLSPDELSGGTFTVTNTGSRGALFDTPIINQPQVAILGTGAVVKRPIVITDANGQDVIAIRSMVYLALSYDHRLVDGADAARFLGSMKSRLEEAAFAAELGL